MTAAKPRIAFIRLGLMRAGFTKRLTRLGYSVMVFDLEIDRMAAASIWTEAVTFCFALSRRKSSGR